MIDSTLSREQLMERICELELLNEQLLAENDRETGLDYAWAGHLGHWYWNVKTDSVICSPNKVAALGYTLEEFPGITGNDFFLSKLHPEDCERVTDAMHRHLLGETEAFEAEYRIQTKDGGWKWFYDRGQVSKRDAEGRPVFVRGTVFDITESKEKARQREKELIFVHPLTGAGNKLWFMGRTKELLQSGGRYALVVLDIDKFKVFNDMFGFEQGDSLLVHIAKVLERHVGEREAFAHLAADKFLILLVYDSKAETRRRMDEVMREIADYRFSMENSFNMVTNAGVYVVEEPQMPFGMMSDRAYIAVGLVKGGYTSRCIFYQDEMRRQIIKEYELEQDMNTALSNSDFAVYIQPKYCLKTGGLAGGEALVRWQHPVKGLIMPDKFIPVFEKNGFITRLDDYMLRRMCETMQNWAWQGRPPLKMSVNQSRLSLSDVGYIRCLKNIISEYHFAPWELELEITESAFCGNINSMTDMTRKLRQSGFKLSIDDFGSEYSALKMLKDTVVDTVKIDRAFFCETSNTARSNKIVSSIVALARELEMETVAEGVETREQASFLRDIGCDLAQGYYFAKPMPLADFDRLIKSIP